jgi:restriction system protein
MGTIWIPPNQFAAFIGDRLGFKSGLALTREEIIDNLDGYGSIAASIAQYSDEPTPLRADEIEDAFQLLLHRLGVQNQKFVGHGPTLLNLKYQNDTEKYHILESVLSLLGSYHFDKGRRALSDGFDRAGFFAQVEAALSADAISIAAELVDLIESSERASLWDWFPARQTNWKQTVELKELFESESLTPMYGTFIDQRFVNYLSQNFEKIEKINWRKFEGLAAEYFSRNGYEVDIGPGRNDGGIDIRVWKANATKTAPPTILIQCKRQKEKIAKVVLKALWADVVDEKAESGLIVTSSTISPGADEVRYARSYPIQVADKFTLRKWLDQLRTPGTGIFLGT